MQATGACGITEGNTNGRNSAFVEDLAGRLHVVLIEVENDCK